MANETEKRLKHAKVSLILAGYCQIPIALFLSFMAVFAGPPWPDVLLVYVTLLSVYAIIESGHGRVNADKPTEDSAN